MTSPAPERPSQGRRPAPAADPQAIRACLTADVAAEFDGEWASALEAAKHSRDLAGVRALLAKWRHLAYAELADPGEYFRVRAAATGTLATGQAPAHAVSGDEVRTLIRERLDRR